MNLIVTTASDPDPEDYAAKRLRSCGRVLALADDKLAALSELAESFGDDFRSGYLDRARVADRLRDAADAHGLIVIHGEDEITRIIADGFTRALVPPRPANLAQPAAQD